MRCLVALCFLSGVLLSADLSADSAFGPDVELLCPCSYSSGSSTSAVTRFGVINRGESATGELVLRAYAHAAENYLDSTEDFLLGQAFIADGLGAGTQVPVSDVTAGYSAPPPGDYYVTLLLLEDLVIVDQTRSREKINLTDNLAGEANVGDYYFVADPDISIAGSSLTLNLPGIGNAGSSNDEIEVLVIATETQRFEQSFIQLAAYTGVTSVPPQSETTSDTAQLAFSDPGPDFPYWHVMLSSGGFVRVVHTVVNADADFETADFSVDGVDYLIDTDGDGVADDNERLAGTDPAQASSTPDASVIDVLVVYNPAVADLYDGDPTVRIDHLFAISNQVLSDSGVNMSLRIAAYEEIGFSNAANLFTLLDQAESETGVFSNIEALKLAAGADIVSLLRTDIGGDNCGLATLGGYPTQGLMSRGDDVATSVINFDACGDITMIHEVGHVMGLGHSFRQNESGTFEWARGHGVLDSFATVMAYASFFDVNIELPYLSNPAVSLCEGQPCGVVRSAEQGANAALSLDAVRFQVARYTSGIDSDNDGVEDSTDAFPNDPTETLDTDGDGTGNNIDTDDDADGVPDSFELANGLNPLVDDGADDPDGDGLTNLEEFNLDSDPQVADAPDICEGPAPDQLIATDSSLAFEKRLVIANPASNLNQQSFLRFSNPGNSAIAIEVYGIDDSGEPSAAGPLSFSLGAQASRQMTAQTLESGTGAGLTGKLCDGAGKWQLRVRSDAALDVMGMIRTPDGFLTGLNDLVPSDTEGYQVYFSNPASNARQVTFLRIANLGASAGTVVITGIDDNGDSASGSVTFSLAADEARQFTISDIENGNVSKGLSGSLGDGAGKWRLTISSTLSLAVQSLIRTSDGFLTNLSGVVPGSLSNQYDVYFVNPASEAQQSTFLRIINTTGTANAIVISATDEAGQIAPGGDISVTLPANAALQMTATDLESGNAAKGLSGALGQGNGRWRVRVSAESDITVMSLVRTPDGFLTNLSGIAPLEGVRSTLLFVNPASNTAQQSTIRLLNTSGSQASITLTATDDAGNPGATDITLNLAARSALDLSAADLENGNAGKGLVGAFGDGQGKWRIAVDATQPVVAQSLLETADGFLTNLSSVVD